MQLNKLIYEATTMEDPSFLYLVVMSMTQRLRREELCGLMWKEIYHYLKLIEYK